MSQPEFHTEFFASADDLAAAERQLAQAGGADRPLCQARLAWHLRQRDRVRSRALADEAALGLAVLGEAPAAQSWRLRLPLMRAEDGWLDGEAEATRQACHTAIAAFTALGDHAGVADALWLLAYVVVPGGAATLAVIDQAEQASERAGDARRRAMCQLRRIGATAYFDPPRGAQMLAESPLGEADDAHPSYQAWLHAARAFVTGHQGETAESTGHYVRACEAALASGQGRMAAAWASNIGVNFLNQNDLWASLEWQERSLDIARRQTGKTDRGRALSLLGSVLVDLQRYDAGMALLLEAEEVLAEGSDSAAINAQLIGEAWLKQHDAARAIHWLERASTRCEALSLRVSANAVRDALARAHLEAGQLAQAWTQGQLALDGSRQLRTPPSEVAALRTLARICMAEAPASTGQTQRAIGYLHEALAVAEAQPGYLVEPDLLASLAEAHARLGDHASAYQRQCEASLAQQRFQGIEASQRTVAMQVRLHTERLRVEADMLRRVADAEAQRAKDLQRSLATLDLLGNVGRDLTASTTEEGVCATLERHAPPLLGARLLAVWRYDDVAARLHLAHPCGPGSAAPPADVALDDTANPVARCARERRVVDLAAAQAGMPPAPGAGGGTLAAPLTMGDTLLGVVTLQWAAPPAQREQTQAVLGTLCAYAAIALANARAAAALAHMARTDTLTGLCNRRMLDQRLAQEMARVERQQGDLALVLVDIDHFKRINDEHGHLEGDRVLAAVAAALLERARQTDIVGRWGGEEFLLVCPGTSLAQACVLADALRLKVAALQHGPALRCTVSLGVCAMQAGDTANGLLARADDALYAAKAAGRNRVEARPACGH